MVSPVPLREYYALFRQLVVTKATAASPSITALFAFWGMNFNLRSGVLFMLAFTLSQIRRPPISAKMTICFLYIFAFVQLCGLRPEKDAFLPEFLFICLDYHLKEDHLMRHFCAHSCGNYKLNGGHPKGTERYLRVLIRLRSYPQYVFTAHSTNHHIGIRY